MLRTKSYDMLDTSSNQTIGMPVRVRHGIRVPICDAYKCVYFYSYKRYVQNKVFYCHHFPKNKYSIDNFTIFVFLYGNNNLLHKNYVYIF